MSKVFVTNITSDDIVDYTEDIKLHHIVCDRTYERSNYGEKQVYMICSYTEYESIIKNGYYEVEDE